MITKTFKWRCGSNLNVSKIGCLMSAGEIVAYAFLEDDDDLSVLDSCEFYLPGDNDHFFDSCEEALDFREHLKKTYISKLKEVAPIIDKFQYYNNDELDITQIIKPLKPKKSYYEEQYWIENKVKKLLLMVIRTGFICINAQNIKVSEVVNVEWHNEYNENREDDDKYYAVLETKGGDKVKTHNEVEYDAVEYLFGENTSRMYYKS